MKNILKKLKKLFSPMVIWSIAAGIVTGVVYLIVGNGQSKGETLLFMLILYVCLLLLGTAAMYALYDRFKESGYLDKASDPTFALLTDINDPVLICAENGEIKWINRAFYTLCANKDMTGQNTSLYFSVQPFILCREERYRDGVSAAVNGRQFKVRGYRSVIGEEEVCITVWQDVTELTELTKRYNEDAPLVAYVVIDNLDEILRFAEGNYRTVASRIDEVMQAWAKENKGIIKEYDRDKYQFVFHASALRKMEEEKFDVLDRIREVRVGESDIPVTVSIGIANVQGDLEERSAASVSALETALQRGGDQAVVKYEKETAVFGGKTKTVQKKTKIRARVVATELIDMICHADNVLIMGHRFADFDAFGSCIGLAHLCAMCKVDYNIVSDVSDPNLRKCFEKAMNIPGVTKDTFIDGASALDRLRSETLLIIADVNNPDQFESAELAANAPTVVCIDHHRKTGEFAVQPKLIYIEPSASSACELVADMLEQSVAPGSLSKDEADLMLAGIVLDTKKYELNTGSKTFGAAQYLKNEGADPTDVQQLFTEDFEDYRREAGFAKVAVYRGKYAVAINENSDDDPSNRVAAAKAADKLLSIEGVKASFALCVIGDAVRVSGRSGGEVNVQLILERIGGGGRYNAAAAELKNEMLTDVAKKLVRSIDRYEEELALSETKPAENAQKERKESL